MINKEQINNSLIEEQKVQVIDNITNVIINFFNDQHIPPDIAIDVLCTSLVVVFAASVKINDREKACGELIKQLKTNLLTVNRVSH